MVPSDYVISALATLMYNESHDDLLLGMTLCGLVVRNRVQAGWENGQWLQLITKHDLYHFPVDNSPRVMKLGDPHNDQIFRRCLATAESIYSNRERDITEGALWYCRLNECSDEFKEKIVRQMPNHPMVATIGRNSCFK
jgi:hypothetical protein